MLQMMPRHARDRYLSGPYGVGNSAAASLALSVAHGVVWGMDWLMTEDPGQARGNGPDPCTA